MGDLGPKGVSQLHKNWVPKGPKTPPFRRRRRRKFNKNEGFKGKLALFGSYKRKIGHILINIMI